jgi:hypothetical protein
MDFWDKSAYNIPESFLQPIAGTCSAKSSGGVSWQKNS